METDQQQNDLFPTLRRVPGWLSKAGQSGLKVFNLGFQYAWRIPVFSEFNFRSSAWILTYVVCAICILTSFFADDRRPTTIGVVHLGLLFALSTFTSCWVSLARHWSRLLFAIFALSALGLLLENTAAAPRSRFDWLLFLLPFAMSLPVVLTLETTKRLAGSFQLLGLEQKDFEEGIQFGIRHLLILTTLVAVLFGLWNFFSESLKEYFLSNQLSRMLSILTLITGLVVLLTLISVWGVLGKWQLWRLALMLPIGLSAVYGASLYAPGNNFWIWTFIFWICWAALLLLLFLLRLEGYRFVKRVRTD